MWVPTQIVMLHVGIEQTILIVTQQPLAKLWIRSTKIRSYRGFHERCTQKTVFNVKRTLSVNIHKKIQKLRRNSTPYIVLKVFISKVTYIVASQLNIMIGIRTKQKCMQTTYSSFSNFLDGVNSKYYNSGSRRHSFTQNSLTVYS